jgi:hypothetical protein
MGEAQAYVAEGEIEGVGGVRRLHANDAAVESWLDLDAFAALSLSGRN